MRSELRQIERKMDSALNARDPNRIVGEMFEGIKTLISIIDELERDIKQKDKKINELVKTISQNKE